MNAPTPPPLPTRQSTPQPPPFHLSSPRRAAPPTANQITLVTMGATLGAFVCAAMPFVGGAMTAAMLGLFIFLTVNTATRDAAFQSLNLNWIHESMRTIALGWLVCIAFGATMIGWGYWSDHPALSTSTNETATMLSADDVASAGVSTAE